MDSFLKIRKYAWLAILLFSVFSVGLVSFGLYGFYLNSISESLKILNKSVDASTDFIRYIQKDTVGIDSNLINKLRKQDLFRNTQTEVELELLDLSSQVPRVFVLHGPKRGFYREVLNADYLKDEHIQRLMKGESNSAHYTDYNDNDVLISYNYISDIKTAVIGRTSVWHVKNNFIPIAQKIGLLTLMFIFVSTSLIYFVDHQISQSFKLKDEELNYVRNKLHDLMSVLRTHFIFSIINEDHLISDVNDRICVVSGFSRNSLIDQPFSLLISPTQNKELENKIWNTLKANKVWSGTLQNRRVDGSSFWLDTIIVPTQERDGSLQFICIQTDVTAQQYLESEMLKSKKMAELDSDRKNQFILHMSHEIRTPLSSILGYTELLENPSLNEESKIKYTSAISRNAQHLKSLIGEILDFSKIESGQFKIDQVQFPLLSEIKKF